MHKLGFKAWNIQLSFRFRSALIHLILDIINQKDTAYIFEINRLSEVLGCRICGEVMGSWLLLGLFGDSSSFILRF